jgi:hypothetical protein
MTSDSAENSNASLEKTDPEFLPHLQALGLNSSKEYQTWCARHGFSTRLKKHWRERCKELYFAKQNAIEGRQDRKKDEQRSPRRTIREIFSGQLRDVELTQPHLALIHETAASREPRQARDAFLQLLLHVEGRTRLLSTQAAIPQFGVQSGNTFIEGLAALARNNERWTRPLTSWEPRSYNARRQFSSLARHLLAQYPVPLFMDSVWFKGQTAEAAKQQEWFLAIGKGKSVRQLDLPFSLTKRMAYHFLQAPPDCSVEAALRWGQVIGLGGTSRLVHAILGSRLGTVFEHDEFWITVIHWLIENPLFDPAQVGPLIDYIHRQKFEPQEIRVAPSKWEVRPPDPDFSLKGRTAASLLRQMQEWHGRLRKEPNRPDLSWPPSGIGMFEWTEGAPESNTFRRWTVMELLSRRELFEEGRAMRHCVASYDNSCAFGGTSIWSLGVERIAGRRKRAVTIEVTNRSKVICQARGKANRLPGEKEMGLLRRWAAQEELALASHVDR